MDPDMPGNAMASCLVVGLVTGAAVLATLIGLAKLILDHVRIV